MKPTQSLQPRLSLIQSDKLRVIVIQWYSDATDILPTKTVRCVTWGIYNVLKHAANENNGNKMCIYMMGLVGSYTIGLYYRVCYRCHTCQWLWYVILKHLADMTPYIQHLNVDPLWTKTLFASGGQTAPIIYMQSVYTARQNHLILQMANNTDGVVDVNTYVFGVRNSFIHLVHAHANICSCIFMCTLYVEKQLSDSSLRSLVLFPAHYSMLLYTLTSDTTSFTPAYYCYCLNTEVTIRWIVFFCSIHVWFTNDCVKWWMRQMFFHFLTSSSCWSLKSSFWINA